MHPTSAPIKVAHCPKARNAPLNVIGDFRDKMYFFVKVALTSIQFFDQENLVELVSLHPTTS
jgi:hypothetical protein